MKSFEIGTCSCSTIHSGIPGAEITYATRAKDLCQLRLITPSLVLIFTLLTDSLLNMFHHIHINFSDG